MINRDLDIRVLSTGGRDPVRVLNVKTHYPALPISPFRFPTNHATWGKPENSRIQVSLNQTAYARIMEHARSGIHDDHNRVEVGGVLLGQAFRSTDEAICHITIEQALPDRRGVGRATSYEFTYESWGALFAEAEERFPTLRIVGWYHSHPDYGAFFSATDQHAQRTYFVAPWHVGLVVDPIRDEGQFFVTTADNENVASLPGFYERLGQDDQSIITWRNWPRPGRSIGPRPPTRAPQLQLPRWNRAMTGVAILWAILVSLLLLLMAVELSRVQKELDGLRPIVQELNIRSTPTPPAHPTPSRQPSPTVSRTLPPTEPALIIIPELLPTSLPQKPGRGRYAYIPCIIERSETGFKTDQEQSCPSR